MTKAHVATTLLLTAGLLSCNPSALAQPANKARLGEASDLEFGRPGEGQGKFGLLTHMAFGPDNRLYVLDGVKVTKGKRTGNALVQTFDDTGKHLGEFSVWDDKLGDKNAPGRLAVDARGHVYVTQPEAGLVRQYGPDGKLVREFPVTGAYAIGVRKSGDKEQILVAGNPPKKEIGQVEVIEGDAVVAPVKLARPLAGCTDLKCDAAGNLFALADQHQVYQFDSAGKLLNIVGGGTRTRAEDGSELLHNIALDSQGRLHALTWGNPAFICRFDRDFKTVLRRSGQFKFADPWSTHSGYTLLAIDRKDRIWIGTTRTDAGTGRYHYQPCILRTVADFLEPGRPSVVAGNTLLLGLSAAVETKLPYQIAYELAPIATELIIKPSNRRVHDLGVRWHVYDVFKNEAAAGRFDLKLQDGAEARQAISFTPKKWGWYTVEFALDHEGQFLTGVAGHLGVTPRYPGLPALGEGQSPGGWDDAPRLAFCGLHLMRVHTGKGLDKLEHDVEAAAKYGLTLLVQFEGKKECDAEAVKAAVSRFKGRVKYWELINEPNFSFKPEEYTAMAKDRYQLIKSIDPAAQVLAPTVCGVQLPWYEAFYKNGGKEACDIVSIHDYEGNESIDPGHWEWKIGELRKIMAAHGDADKPIWQTERAIGGVRGKAFLGGCQVVRVMLHRDLLETFGIPNEHNLHYYLNAAGYNSVPSYLWAAAGPHPAALATRTRAALVREQKFTGKLDFGPTGNKIFLGLRFEGPERSTLILRNLGTAGQPLELAVSSGDSVQTIDAFGNTATLPVQAGRVKVLVSALPLYVRPAQGQTVTVPKIDFGKNLAAQLTFTYSAATTSDPALLTNGILEAPHPSNPNRNFWTGDLPAPGQTLELKFPEPRSVSKLLVFSVRADNPYCALLDYDLQYHDGRSWKTLEEVRSACPASDRVHTPLCATSAWYLDQNFFVHRFQPVKTDRLRLVVKRTTFGFMPDAEDVRAWGGQMPAKLMLREIEVYE